VTRQGGQRRGIAAFRQQDGTTNPIGTPSVYSSPLLPIVYSASRVPLFGLKPSGARTGSI